MKFDDVGTARVASVQAHIDLILTEKKELQERVKELEEALRGVVQRAKHPDIMERLKMKTKSAVWDRARWKAFRDGAAYCLGDAEKVIAKPIKGDLDDSIKLF